MTTRHEDVTREELHTRRIELDAYRRSDGLFEIEGRVIDRKPFEFRSPNGDKRVPAGAAIHDVAVCLVFDETMLVVDVHGGTAAAPYDECYAAKSALDCLKGLRIGAGWGSEVRRRLGGAQGCTHMMELLGPMATAAYQALTGLRAGRPDVLDSAGRPRKIDSCFAYAASGTLVMRRWPAHYTGPAATAAQDAAGEAAGPA